MSPWLSELFLSSQSDERLVSLAGSGHDRAFAVIVERYRRPLLAFARGLDSHGRAEDIVQQAFLSAFAALRAGTEVEHVRGWLHQIVRNTAIRSSARHPHEAGLAPDEVSSSSLQEHVEQRALAFGALSEMARLPERQRDALIETALNGRSRAEVAHAMGVTEGSVRQLVHRARNTLRAAVTAVTPYPLAEWFATAHPAPSADRIAEIAVGAGAASTGGLAIKVGAVVVSGVVATGLVTGQTGHRQHQPHARTHASSTPGPRAQLAPAHTTRPLVDAVGRTTARRAVASSHRPATPSAHRMQASAGSGLGRPSRSGSDGGDHGSGGSGGSSAGPDGGRSTSGDGGGSSSSGHDGKDGSGSSGSGSVSSGGADGGPSTSGGGGSSSGGVIQTDGSSGGGPD